MDETAHKKNKIYYSIGEVAEMFDVNTSLIRFWEKKFDIIKPHKNKKGNRMFTPKDVDNLKLIYHLVKERGMTLAGAQKRLKENKDGAVLDMDIVERLLNIRSMLVEIREELKKEGEIITPEGYLDEEYVNESPETLPEKSSENDTPEYATDEEDDIIMLTAEVSTEIVTDGSSPWIESDEDGTTVSQDDRNKTMEELHNVKEEHDVWNDISETESPEPTAHEVASQQTETDSTTNDPDETYTGLGNIFDDELDDTDEYADPWEEIDDTPTTETATEDADEDFTGKTEAAQADMFGTDACTTFSPDDAEAAADTEEQETQEPKRPQIYEQTLF